MPARNVGAARAGQPRQFQTESVPLIALGSFVPTVLSPTAHDCLTVRVDSFTGLGIAFWQVFEVTPVSVAPQILCKTPAAMRAGSRSSDFDHRRSVRIGAD